MKTEINRELITDQMNSLGLSERQVLNRCGIAAFQLRAMRKEGVVQGHVTVRELTGLAAVLGVSVADFFTVPVEHQPAHDARTTPDAQVLIPLLTRIPRLVDVGHLARVLGWERGRVRDALESVDGALEGTGLRLVRINGQIMVKPADTSQSTRAALGKLQAKNMGMNARQASLLLRVVGGSNVLGRGLDNADKVAIGALRNMGCVELSDSAGYSPSAALVLALGMSD